MQKGKEVKTKKYPELVPDKEGITIVLPAPAERERVEVGRPNENAATTGA